MHIQKSLSIRMQPLQNWILLYTFRKNTGHVLFMIGKGMQNETGLHWNGWWNDELSKIVSFIIEMKIGMDN